MPINCPGKQEKTFKTFDEAVAWSKSVKCKPPCRKSRLVIQVVGRKAYATVWCKKPTKG